MHAGRIDDMHASVIIILGANADLNRAFYIHNPLFHSLVKHSAMIHTRQIIIRPSVGMGVKLDQGQGAKFLRIGPQNWEGDVMISAKGQNPWPLSQNTRNMRLKSCGKGRDIGVVKGQIPIVTYIEIRQRIDVPAMGGITGLQGARFTDGARAQPCAWPIGHRLIKRNTRDRKIHALQIF